MRDIEFRLPDVGEGLAEATISAWLAAEGEPVTRMESMVEVETAKSSVEIPSPVTGVMLRHGAPASETLPVGALLAVLRVDDAEAANAGVGSSTADDPGDSDTASGPARAPLAVAAAASYPTAATVDRTASTVPAHEPAGVARRLLMRAAPTVRRRAQQAGVNLADVPATGDGGRVLMADLERHLAAATSLRTGGDRDGTRAPRGHGIQSERAQTLSPMRTAIVESLTAAWSTVPLITDLREVDATELTRLRTILRDEIGTESRFTYTALFCTVVIAALRRHPEFNIWFDADSRTVTYKEHIDLGVAVSVPGGLSVGVVHGAESLPTGELAAAINDLAGRARAGRLSRSDMSGATVTVTSFGTHGGWFGTPLVIPPQALIVGIGGIRDRAVAVDGKAAVRPVAPLSVSADHRVIDGAELSTFCSTLERLIVEPARMAVI
jgi:pyruvate/2-oxoglutarate dehydrogenase complex dihydrolipoamide acyltransferase (E2) component